jgi:hypothetical protein
MENHSTRVFLPDFDDGVLFSETLTFEVVAEWDDGRDGAFVVLRGIDLAR